MTRPTRKPMYIGRREVRAAALELLHLQGFVPNPDEKPTDVTASDHPRALQAVEFVRRVLAAAAAARGIRARVWIRQTRLFGGST